MQRSNSERMKLAPAAAIAAIATLAIVARADAQAAGNAVAVVFDTNFVGAADDVQQALSSWTMSGPQTPAWKLEARQGVNAAESAGPGSVLARELKATAGQPLSVVVEYGWRGGRGAGAAELVLADQANQVLTIAMRQSAGEKYEVTWADAAGGEARRLATLKSDILDAGVQSGGIAEAPAVLHVRVDPTQKTLMLARLGGERVQVNLPAAFVPASVRLADRSRGQEQLRLARARSFAGDVDPVRDMAELTMPFGASFVEERDVPTIRLSGRWFSDESRRATLDAQVVEQHRPRERQARHPVRLQADLKPGATTELKLSALPSLAPGIYRLNGQLKVGEQALPIDARFAVLSRELAERPQAQIPRWMGMVPFINVLPRDVYVESFDYMNTLGVRHVRWLPGWGRLEPEENQYDWGETDQFMDLVAKHDMHAMFCLSYFGGDWASEKTGGQLARSPEGRALWVEKFAVPTIKRYGDRVKLWQIWNEPDAFWNEDPEKAHGFATAFATPQNYMDLVKRTHTAAHQLSIPDLRIMASLASGEIPQNTKLLFELGLGEHFDGMIIHTYGHHVRHFELLRKQLASLGKPNAFLGAGETGLPAPPAQRRRPR